MREIADLARALAPSKERLEETTAQGAAFAAEARVRSGTSDEATHRGTRILCASDPETAAALARECRDAARGDAEPYLAWRRELAARLRRTGDAA